MKAMFPLSETCFHYQKKLSANQVIRLRCPENFWRGIVVSLRRIGLTSCLMRQACSPKIHHKELSPILFRLDGMVAARMRGAVTHSLTMQRCGDAKKAENDRSKALRSKRLQNRGPGDGFRLG